MQTLPGGAEPGACLEEAVSRTGQEIFDKKQAKAVTQSLAEHEHKQSKLYETIGQLAVERDFLKKSWEKFQGSNDDN